jgi:ABC-type lipoprotein export system ATPase subunit
LSGATVQAIDVARRFDRGSDEVWAVHGVSLSVQPAEVLALVGRSGSGKTTLLNILAGLDRPTTGEVFLDGEPVHAMSEHQLTELRRHKLGFVFQSFGLLPLLSAQENVELPLRISGFKHGERVKRAKQALELVGLTRRAQHRPYELSGGEQQRVAIARALTCDPSLILADEPTGELDSNTARAVFGLLRDLARSQGITVIACTHDRLVMDMADRVEELADGRLVTGHMREVFEHAHTKAPSPFAAPAGATPAQGGVPGHPARTPGAPATDERASPPAAAHDESDDDITRWAPPAKKS